MSESSLKTLQVGQGTNERTIAVRMRGGASQNTGSGLFWLGGFKSDMMGTKAQALDAWAAEKGRACIRFDYSGHGESSGKFVEGTISKWLEESVAVFTQFARGPQVLVGSSMGGWIALLLARALAKQNNKDTATIAGMVLIAPAVDFTEALMWKGFSPEIKNEIETKGFWQQPSDYPGEPYIITRDLVEDGRKHLLLGGLIETGCPVRVLQGVQDTAVPMQHVVDFMSCLAHDDVVLTLVKDGDHRLSRPEDLERLIAAIEEF